MNPRHQNPSIHIVGSVRKAFAQRYLRFDQIEVVARYVEEIARGVLVAEISIVFRGSLVQSGSRLGLTDRPAECGFESGERYRGVAAHVRIGILEHAANQTHRIPVAVFAEGRNSAASQFTIWIVDGIHQRLGAHTPRLLHGTPRAPRGPLFPRRVRWDEALEQRTVWRARPGRTNTCACEGVGDAPCCWY